MPDFLCPQLPSTVRACLRIEHCQVYFGENPELNIYMQSSLVSFEFLVSVSQCIQSQFIHIKHKIKQDTTQTCLFSPPMPPKLYSSGSSMAALQDEQTALLFWPFSRAGLTSNPAEDSALRLCTDLSKTVLRQEDCWFFSGDCLTAQCMSCVGKCLNIRPTRKKGVFFGYFSPRFNCHYKIQAFPY